MVSSSFTMLKLQRISITGTTKGPGDSNGLLSGQLSVNGSQMTINNLDATVVDDEVISRTGDGPDVRQEK